MIHHFKNLFRNTQFWFWLIFGFASVFYIFHIGFSDLWSDEIYTKSMLEGSLKDFYGKFRNDLHPPLYFLGLRIFTGIFGITTVSLRLFSVIGILSTLVLGYYAGQRVFGKQGAIYFCLMMISIPMLAVYSHQARMYTWALFSVTGVFIYSYLFIKSATTHDLVFLTVFNLIAVYIHYYSMVAAFAANLFVLLYLIMTNNKKWINHLIAIILTVVLFSPWLFMFIDQVRRVQHAFWAPEVNFSTILSCFTFPFYQQYHVAGYSDILYILFYTIIVLTIFRSFTQPYSNYRLILWLSLSIFLGTLFIVAVISLFSQPILYYRYVSVIVVMLGVPPTVFFIQMKIKWLRTLMISMILLLGIRISFSSYYFSYGPYKQTVDYIKTAYPEISKVLHITEVTAGPMLEYNGNSGLNHYWLKAEMSNVDAFAGIHQYRNPEEFLKAGEVFCTVRFLNLELNKENLDLVLSESELIRTDTVHDNKVENGIYMQVYILRYNGN